jgi:multidrug efflux pump subunit AcrA (membrane-fusion protein)
VRRATIFLLLAALVACKSENAEDKPQGTDAKEAPTPETPTPVKLGVVAKQSIPIFVSGPGKTSALVQQKVRAPFAGTLASLTVSDGDAVQHGQVLGMIVARDSEAALSGAREMLRQATTPAERSDAERAVSLAEKNLVRKPLVAAWDGAVLSHAASPGDKVAEDQEILTVNDAASLVFLADIAQADLARIQPGQKANIEIAGAAQPLNGAVHAVLPGANPTDYTGSVRIDLPPASRRLAVGIFGKARILVAEHANAAVVPDAAVLRDDVSGTARVALVSQNRAHWVKVKTGISASGTTEITEPALSAGQSVIISGLVGLPEGKLVAPEP